MTTFAERFGLYSACPWKLIANEQTYQDIERVDVASGDVDWHIGLFHLLLHACTRRSVKGFQRIFRLHLAVDSVCNPVCDLLPCRFSPYAALLVARVYPCHAVGAGDSMHCVHHALPCPRQPTHPNGVHNLLRDMSVRNGSTGSYRKTRRRP